MQGNKLVTQIEEPINQQGTVGRDREKRFLEVTTSPELKKRDGWCEHSPGTRGPEKARPAVSPPSGTGGTGHSAAGGITEAWGGVGGRLGEGQRQRQRAGGR